MNRPDIHSLYRLCFDSGPEALLVVGWPGGVVHAVNPAAVRLLDRPAESLLGHPLIGLFDQAAERLALADLSAPVPLCLSSAPDRQLLIEALGPPDSEGRSLYRITEDRSRATCGCPPEVLLRAICDGIDDAILARDRQGVCVFANQAVHRLLGLGPEQVIGQDGTVVLGDELARRWRESDLAIMASGTTRTEEHLISTPQGTRTLLTSRSALRDSEGHVFGVFAIGRDITRLKQSESSLRQQKELLETILDNIPVMIALYDTLGRVRWINRTLERTLGWTLADHQQTDILARVHPDPAERARAIASVHQASGQWLDFRTHTREGQVLATKWANVRLSDGSRVGIGKDVTVQKQEQEEQEAQKRKLQEAQKLESLGVLAGGVAHDFNNLLTSVLGYANLARMDAPIHSPISEYLQHIEVAARRAADLCQQMLAYAGKGRYIVQTVDLASLVSEMTPLLTLTVSRRAALNFRLASGVPPIEGDQTQLRQMVLELVTNASESLGELEGTITLHVEKQAILRTPMSSMFPDELPPGDYVVLEVSDTGAGMSEATRERIFEPFFTTKFTGRGLGLAAVLGIVRGHRGGLRVQSEPGRGSTFRLYFPARSSGPTSLFATRGGGTLQGRVLVVDDEPGIRGLTALLLESLGFQVLLAEDGPTALDRLAEVRGDVRLVLLDLTMPGMDGSQVVEYLGREHPGLRVVLMSGYSEQELEGRFAGRTVVGFLQKPFVRADLEAKICQVLEK